MYYCVFLLCHAAKNPATLVEAFRADKSSASWAWLAVCMEHYVLIIWNVGMT